MTIELRDSTGITEGGAQILAQMKQLKVIDLVGSKVSGAGIEKLLTSLPNCRIVSAHGTFEPMATPKK